MTLYKWSKTAENNATADPSINWQEGQAPSSVNDSGRAMMASIAKHRDDIAGAIVTGGTATAYTVASYEAFDTLARLNGQTIAFTPHVTNGGTVMLNVDSLGARPVRSAPSVELLAGTLIQWTPYLALYNQSDAVFYLHGFFGNPYNVPLAAGLDYWAATTPNSAFAFPIGQAISRTTYAALFALIGTTYGVGDGSLTFTLPDKRGRASMAVDPTGGIVNSATMTPDGSTLGAKGGFQASVLSTANLPAYTPSGTIAVSNGAISGTANNVILGGTSGGGGVGGGGAFGLNGNASLSVSQGTTTASFSGTPQGGTSVAFSNMQPTIACNYIMRVL
jgi:microcystin-dependent protein